MPRSSIWSVQHTERLKELLRDDLSNDEMAIRMSKHFWYRITANNVANLLSLMRQRVLREADSRGATSINSGFGLARRLMGHAFEARQTEAHCLPLPNSDLDADLSARLTRKAMDEVLSLRVRGKITTPLRCKYAMQRLYTGAAVESFVSPRPKPLPTRSF